MDPTNLRYLDGCSLMVLKQLIPLRINRYDSAELARKTWEITDAMFAERGIRIRRFTAPNGTAKERNDL